MYIINVYDFKEWDVWFAGDKYEDVGVNKKGYTLKQWAEREKADMVFNHAFFAMPTKEQIAKGIAYHIVEYVYLHQLGIIGYGDCNIPRLVLPNGDSTSGWLIAIENGVVKAPNTSTRRSRNMHGLLADGRYIHVQTTTGNTEKAVALYVNDYVQKNYHTTVKLLLIEDAGGSTGAYSNVTKTLFAPEKEGANGRAVPSVVCVKRKITGGITRSLRQGATGEDVRLLQQVLNSVEADGIFGAGTTTQLKIVQRNLGLSADGVAGPKTLQALGLWGAAPSIVTPAEGEIVVNVNGQDYCVKGKNENGTIYVGLRDLIEKPNLGTITYVNSKATIKTK